MPRLFVATDLSEAQQQALRSLRDDTLDARWTPAEQYHLTLRFVGEVTQDRVAAITAALEGVDAVTFSLAGEGLGVFPSIRKPRVLVILLHVNPALLRLQQAVEAALAQAGVPPEARPFRPHATVARLKRVRPRAMRAYLRAHARFSLAPFEVRAFHLYESVLHPGGAVHERRASFSLSTPA